MIELKCKKTYAEDGYTLYTAGKSYAVESEDEHGVFLHTDLGDTGNLLWDAMAEYFEGVCSECGHILGEEEPVCVIDEGKETERVVCERCCGSMCEDDKVVQCGNCGAYWLSTTLHEEKIHGYTFMPCLACGKDVVEGMTREEYESEDKPDRYAVIVRDCQGRQRGYVVSVGSADGRTEVVWKLAEKVNLDGVAEITIAQILSEKDEF